MPPSLATESTATSSALESDIAQFLWVEGDLSVLEQVCLMSFVKHGYEVHLYSYYPPQNVPEGVIVKDGREILPESRLFKANCVSGISYTAFANLFRYQLLWQKGGWWFDMDFVSWKRMECPRDLYIASTWEQKWKQCAINCAIWAKAGDMRVRWAVEQSENYFAKHGDNIKFGATGPSLVQRLVREQDLSANVAPWWEFCPFPWRMIRNITFTTNREWAMQIGRSLKHRLKEQASPTFRAGYIRSGTRAIHLHNEIWKAAGMDKSKTYHPRCQWEKIKRKILDT